MKRLLPLGSIVILDTEKNDKIMIISRLVKKAEGNEEIYDYCGCFVPYGIQGDQELQFFNHEDIKRLLFVGYQDEEELQFSFLMAEQFEQSKNNL